MWKSFADIVDRNIQDLNTYSDALSSITEDNDRNGSTMYSLYNRFFALHALQMDCIRSLVELGRCNFGQKANISAVPEEAPRFKEAAILGSPQIRT